MAPSSTPREYVGAVSNGHAVRADGSLTGLLPEIVEPQRRYSHVSGRDFGAAKDLRLIRSASWFPGRYPISWTPRKPRSPLVPVVLNRPLITRGTDSSNPSPSRRESSANLTSSGFTSRSLSLDTMTALGVIIFELNPARASVPARPCRLSPGSDRLASPLATAPNHQRAAGAVDPPQAL
jgi:hypothetical protein